MDREGWNRKYLEHDLLWSAGPNRLLVEELTGLAPGSALDLGAGEGRNAIWLAERGWKVTAVDFSDVALEKARRIAASRGVEVDFVGTDLTEYQPEVAAYDLVMVLYLHLQRPEMAVVVQRAARAVASGGLFLLIGHDRSNLDHGYGGPRSPEALYDADEIADLLSGFEIEASGTRRRAVETEQGTVSAIDCLVRARSV